MVEINIKINTDNSAFEGPDKWYEIWRIVGGAINKMQTTPEGKLLDINGNIVGEYYISDTDED